MLGAQQLHQRKYPIGPFSVRDNISNSELNEFIETIASAPAAYAKVAQGLSREDLQKTYREGSWNVQQIVNHVADMQLLHFFRMKKALTEPDYKEVTLVNIDGWARTSDGLTSPIGDSLDMFEGITKRFVYLMRSLDERQYRPRYREREMASEVACLGEPLPFSVTFKAQRNPYMFQMVPYMPGGHSDCVLLI